MASNLEGQGEGEPTPTSTMETDEENTELSSCKMALQNDLILRNIFDFLPLPDLKSCRLVNRQWKQSSQDGCIKKCDTIGFFGISVDRVNFCKLHRIHEMPDLIQLISTSGDAFPCRSFLVESRIVSLVDDDAEQEALLADFFCAIAPIAEQLWFDKLGGRNLFNGLPPQNLHFPRLKSLELWEGKYGVKENLASNLNFCREIIQNSPQLATLELIFTRAEAANQLIDLLESVQGHKLSLHLHGPLTDTHFNKMIGIGLRLRSLWLSFARGSALSKDGESLTNLLSSQNDSLEGLHLRCGKNLKREIEINFPRMEKITHLCLEIDLFVSRGLKFPRISYAENFPVLQSLSLAKFTGKDSIVDFRMKSIDSVTTLELPINLRDSEWIWQAARIFPNVKKLTVPSYGPVVRAVYEAWQKVEELAIVKREFDWDLDRDSANNVLSYSRDNYDDFSSLPVLNESDFQPVEFLHKLKVLRLQHKNRLAITDRACRVVLLKLRSLRCLDLSEGSAKRISKEVLQEMRDKFSVIC